MDAMEYSLVKIVLGEIAKSPEIADMAELDSAIDWVGSHVVVYGNEKGLRRVLRNPVSRKP